MIALMRLICFVAVFAVPIWIGHWFVSSGLEDYQRLIDTRRVYDQAKQSYEADIDDAYKKYCFFEAEKELNLLPSKDVEDAVNEIREWEDRPFYEKIIIFFSVGFLVFIIPIYIVILIFK